MEIKSLNLLTEGSVPEDASCLLIDSPTTDISEDEKTALIDYLENGGKAMIFSDYTGEKMENFDAVLETVSYTHLEIDCHGGVYAMNRVLETVLKKGAKIAGPGEFTK